MKRFWIVPALCVPAACGSQEAEQWSYQRVMWEREPLIRSADDAKTAADRIAGKETLTLDDCFRLALQRSERIAIDGEELVRIQSLYDQSVGAVLPRLSIKASYTRADTSGVDTSSSGFVFKDRTEYKLYARQPIFSGLKETYAIRQANALYEAGEHALRQARLDLFADVAEAFYAVLQLEREFATREDSLKLARERLEELTQRNKAGISRRSEVLAQEAEVSSVQAGVESLKGALAVAREALKFATGLGRMPALNDALPPPGSLPPVETLTARALAARSDLHARRKALEAAEESVGVARSGWFPTVSLEGNYYTHREGVSGEVDWDATLTGELPLFDGFTTAAKVRQAESDVRIARFEHERLQRQVGLDISRSHADVTSLQSQRESLEAAVASAQEHHDTVQAEYRQGIVTNLEVLAAFDTLQRATSERDRARFEMKLAFVRLAASCGVMPEELK